ncbi:hypothetical protein [Photobacterium sp. DNB22_13_2]
MSIEQQIGALVEASNDLTKVVNGKIGKIDQRMDKAEKDTQATIDKLNSGHLDSLIIVKNSAGIGLLEPKDTYRRVVTQYTGDSDAGTDHFVDLFSFKTQYAGHYIKVFLSSYQRGRQLGVSGELSIRANSNPFTSPPIDEMLISFSAGDDISSYIQVLNSSGEVIEPNEHGIYSFIDMEVMTIQVLVKQYWQVSAVVDIQAMAK